MRSWDGLVDCRMWMVVLISMVFFLKEDGIGFWWGEWFWGVVLCNVLVKGSKKMGFVLVSFLLIVIILGVRVWCILVMICLSVVVVLVIMWV